MALNQLILLGDFSVEAMQGDNLMEEEGLWFYTLKHLIRLRKHELSLTKQKRPAEME